CSGALRQEFRELEMLDAITADRYEEKLPLTVTGVTRTQLISSYRKWKGHEFVPKQVHVAIAWDRKNPFELEELYDPRLRATEQTDGYSISEGTTFHPKQSPIDSARKVSHRDQGCNALRSKQHRGPNSTWRLSWSNNSCAYDCIFMILYASWLENPRTLDDVLTHTSSQFTDALYRSFPAIKAGTLNFEDL
ncbi:hypothetical protein BJ165DRAFT_1321195, partial [Panaeolus papilionaceus]